MDKISERGPPGPLMNHECGPGGPRSSHERAWRPTVRLEKHLWPAIAAALLSAVAFLWASPFLWTLVASFRPEGAGSADMASLLPDLHPTLENFRNALESGSFGVYFLHTIIVLTGPLAVPGVAGSPARYALARLRVPGRGLPVYGL